MAFDGIIGLVFPAKAELDKVTGVDTARLLDQARSGRGGRINRRIKGAAVEVVMLADPSNRRGLYATS